MINIPFLIILLTLIIKMIRTLKHDKTYTDIIATLLAFIVTLGLFIWAISWGEII